MKREPYESGKLSERIRENFKYFTGEGRGSVGLAPACFCIAAVHRAAVIVWNICAVIF